MYISIVSTFIKCYVAVIKSILRRQHYLCNDVGRFLKAVELLMLVEDVPNIKAHTAIGLALFSISHYRSFFYIYILEKRETVLFSVRVKTHHCL